MKVNALFELVKVEYDRDGAKNRRSNLHFSMIQPSGDDFSVMTAKAAETQSLLKPVLAITSMLDDDSERSTHRILMLTHLGKFYSTLRASSMFLTKDAADTVLSAINSFLLHYNWLAKDAAAKNQRRYQLVFKHHNLWHIAYLARWLNPTSIWCYEFEAFMAVDIRPGRGCLADTHMKHIGRKVLENFCLVLELTLRHSCRSKVEA